MSQPDRADELRRRRRHVGAVADRRQARAPDGEGDLKLYDPPRGRHPGGERGSIPFQFNPKEVTIQKAAKWERKTAKGAKKAGPPEFSGSEPCKLTLEMFFDASGKQDGSVVEAVEKLFSCSVPTEESRGKKKPSPPLVVLHWGGSPASRRSSLGERQVHAVHRRRPPDPGAVQRRPGGDAERAVAAEPHLRQRLRRRVAHVVEGDTLASVAYAEYGDPTRGGRWPGSTASTTRCAACPAPGCCCPSAEEL